MNNIAPHKNSYKIFRNTGNIDILVIILSAAAAVFLVFAVVLYGVKEKERENRINFQNQLNETLAAKDKAESRLREIEIENTAIKERIKAKDDELGALSGNLEEAKAISARSAAALKEKEAQVSRLKADLEEVIAERDKLVRDFEKLNYEHLELKVYFNNLMKTKEEMDKRAKEISEREGVSLGTIILNQSSKGG